MYQTSKGDTCPATLGPGYVSNIKGKYMPSALRAVLYHIYSDYRYL